MTARLVVDVIYCARRPWVPGRGQFARWAEATLPAGTGRMLMSVSVVGTLRSRRLNAHYRRKDKATNVLSFQGAGLAPDGAQHLGELVICAPVVAREAQDQGKAVRAHWAHMTVHGTLHLLGFDHEHAADARKMTGREIQILDRLGFSNPYA